MEWKRELKKSVLLTLFFFLSFHPEQQQRRQALAQELPVSLTINPVLAIIGDTVQVACSVPLDANPSAVFYELKRNDKLVAQQHVRCEAKVLTGDGGSVYTLASGSLGPPDCAGMTIGGIVAEREALAGTYQCYVQTVSSSYARSLGQSGPVRVTVGDKTPPVSAFTVVASPTADTGPLDIVDGLEVAAGTKTTVTCETAPVTPEPAFVVSISGKENRTNLTVGHRVSFHEEVPREPKVVYTCEVYNGFGDKQYKQITITATYGVIASEVTVPAEVTIGTGEDVEICRARNNPSQQLEVIVQDAQMLQDGYPTYKQEPGISLAYVRLSSKAAEVKDARLEFTCGLGEERVKASVALVASSSAMMTAGIVIGAILVFLLVVAGVAYFLKRRSAEPKPASDKAGYGRVKQNDADQGGYNAGGGSSMAAGKVTGSNQPVPV